MEVKHGDGKTEYGPGVSIELTGDEVATAIDAYLVSHGVYVGGPRTIRVNGDLCETGNIYVDPSGFVVANGNRLSGLGPNAELRGGHRESELTLGSASDKENEIDWIDKAIRDLCESIPEDDPDAIVSTPSEIRAAIESNIPSGLTDLQRQALEGLLALARASYHAVDDGQVLSPAGSVVIEPNAAEALSLALDRLEELPDDQPGYTMSGPAKAAWALRDLMLNVK